MFKYSSIHVFKYRVYKLATHLPINNVKSRDPIGSKKGEVALNEMFQKVYVKALDSFKRGLNKSL